MENEKIESIRKKILYIRGLKPYNTTLAELSLQTNILKSMLLDITPEEEKEWKIDSSTCIREIDRTMGSQFRVLQAKYTTATKKNTPQIRMTEYEFAFGKIIEELGTDTLSTRIAIDLFLESQTTG